MDWVGYGILKILLHCTIAFLKREPFLKISCYLSSSIIKSTKRLSGINTPCIFVDLGVVL